MFKKISFLKPLQDRLKPIQFKHLSNTSAVNKTIDIPEISFCIQKRIVSMLEKH